MINKFEEEMVQLKRQSQDFTKSSVKLHQAIKATDDAIKKDKQSMKIDFKELVNTLNVTNDMLLGRKQKKEQPEAIGDRPSSNRVNMSNPANNEALSMSPFDKRIGSYTRGALNRSNSRGPSNVTQQSVNSSAGAGGFRPPKLTMQQSAGARGGKKVNSSSGLASPIRTDNNRITFNNPDLDWSTDLQQIKSKLLAYENSLSRYVEGVSSKHEVVCQILGRYDDQLNGNVLKFVNTHDTDLVKSFYINSVLTPTEVAQLVAKVNF